MQTSGEKNRNVQLDIFRGIAMLMVVLGHTISGCVSDYENSMLMNIIWTLQMPLFMLISGYVTCYSRPVRTGHDLLNFIKRRSCSYLIPWTVWTFIVRGLIFMQHSFLAVRNLLWKMDTGYWFLFSIWTISMIFGISQFLSHRFRKRSSGELSIIGVLIVSVLLAAALALVGIKVGLSFLCIKLTLYYIPFFYAGYLFSVLQKKYKMKKWFGTAVNYSVAACSLVYVCLLLRFDFFVMGDSVREILVRMIASFTGCITVFGLGTGLISSGGGVLLGLVKTPSRCTFVTI